ncbi:MAG: ParM/StbA family protein [Fusobacterium necrophorum]|nr:ParM/StbA family protein [Fusobacterium necrophorum]
MKLITVDLGSFNIKTSEGITFENRFLKDNHNEVFGSEVLTFEGNNYFFGKGDFNKTFIKANKEIEVPLLYALAKSGVEGDVNLILHLPSSQMTFKDEIIERLEGKEFKYSVNGVEQVTKFNKVGILKEGWSSFYSLAKRNTGLIGVIDVGGRTTDVFTFSNGINVEEKSIPVGTINLFSEIADVLIGKGENRRCEDIHRLLENNIIDIEDFEEVVEKYGNRIINDIKESLPSLSDYKIYLTGGGATFFEKCFKKYFKVEIMSNNLISNCAGSFNIGKAKAWDK